MDLWKIIAEMSGEGQNFVIPRLYVELTGSHIDALVIDDLGAETGAIHVSK